MSEGRTETTLEQRVTGHTLEQERERTARNYEALSEREKQNQASFWSLIFLVAELAAGNRLLRDLLIDKNILTAEEDEKLGKSILDTENLKTMYANTERAFYEKYQRVRYAMENPEEVERQIKERDAATFSAGGNKEG